jgi:hypothetical protein
VRASTRTASRRLPLGQCRQCSRTSSEIPCPNLCWPNSTIALEPAEWNLTGSAEPSLVVTAARRGQSQRTARSARFLGIGPGSRGSSTSRRTSHRAIRQAPFRAQSGQNRSLPAPTHEICQSDRWIGKCIRSAPEYLEAVAHDVRTILQGDVELDSPVSSTLMAPAPSVGRQSAGTRRACRFSPNRKELSEVGGWSWNDVDPHELSHATCRRGAGISRRLHRPDVTTDDSCNESASTFCHPTKTTLAACAQLVRMIAGVLEADFGASDATYVQARVSECCRPIGAIVSGVNAGSRRDHPEDSLEAEGEEGSTYEDCHHLPTVNVERNRRSDGVPSEPDAPLLTSVFRVDCEKPSASSAPHEAATRYQEAAVPIASLLRRR